MPEVREVPAPAPAIYVDDVSVSEVELKGTVVGVEEGVRVDVATIEWLVEVVASTVDSPEPVLELPPEEPLLPEEEPPLEPETGPQSPVGLPSLLSPSSRSTWSPGLG